MYNQNMSPAERVQAIDSKVAKALSEAWMKGERRLVKQTIDGGCSMRLSKQWQDDTAAALPEAEREAFITYMRG